MGGLVLFCLTTLFVASGASRGDNWAVYRSGGITVIKVAPTLGVDNVIHDKEDPGRPPLPYWGYLMRASKN